MSETTDRVKRILAAQSGGATRPHDYDLRVAEVLCALAQAEAMERLAAAIEVAQHGDHAVPIRTVVVPS